MTELLDIMEDAYQCVTEDKRTLDSPSESRIAVLEALSQQTIECAYFIRQGVKDTNFCEYIDSFGHFFTNAVSNRDARREEFSARGRKGR